MGCFLRMSNIVLSGSRHEHGSRPFVWEEYKAHVTRNFGIIEATRGTSIYIGLGGAIFGLRISIEGHIVICSDIV
jgi:hypothetical protein